MLQRAGTFPVYAVAFAAMLWGAWWIPLRLVAERGVASDWSSAAFGLAATVLLLPLAILRGRRLLAGGTGLLWIGLFVGAAFAALNHAMINGFVVRAILLFYLSPVWATLLAVAFLGERPGLARLASVLLGLAGAAVILGVGETVPLPRSMADWLGLVAGMLWAAGLTFVRKRPEIPSLDATFAALAGSALFALLLAGGLSPAELPAWPRLADVLLAVVALAAVWLLPMTFLELWGAARMDPGRVCIVLLLDVVVAAATAAAFTDEPFGWRELAGSLLVIGAGLVELREQARLPAAA